MAELHRSQSREKRKRKLFSDLTNAPSFPFTSSSSPAPPSPPPPLKAYPSPPPAIDATIQSGDRENPRGGESPASTPPPNAPRVDSDANGDDQGCLTASKRQRAAERKDKGKSIASRGALSCPPIGRIRSVGHKLESAHADVGHPKSYSVPCRKPKKKQRQRMPKAVQKPLLPQDFVDKQRAYFAEVDAFELPEEVVSESEVD